MYARVTTFEGGDAEAIRALTEEVKSRSATGPPEGVPSVGLTMLIGSRASVDVYEVGSI